MQYRPLAVTLALAAALFVPESPAGAQQATPVASTSPEPSASPEPSGTGAMPGGAASALPSPGASPSASAEPSAAPGDAGSPAPAAAGHSLRGTLMSVKGTIATVKMANGTVQTYTVSTKAAALLKKSVGKKLVFRVLHGALDVLPH